MIHYIYELALEQFNVEDKTNKLTGDMKIIEMIFFDESLEHCSELYHECLLIKL